GTTPGTARQTPLLVRPRRRTARTRPGRSREPERRCLPVADSRAFFLFAEASAQAVDRAEEQQLHGAFAATHDQPDLLVLEPALELEQDRLPLVEGELSHRPVQLIALLPTQPESFGIVLATAGDRIGQLDPGRPPPPFRHQVCRDFVQPC